MTYMFKHFLRWVKNIFRNDKMGEWVHDLDHSIVIWDDLKLIAEYNDRGYGLNINNYTKIDVPSAYDLKFKVYEGKDWAYVIDVNMIETLYFLFIPVWHIFYQKYIIRFPKEYLQRKDLGSLIFDIIYHDYEDRLGKPNTKYFLHKDMKYVVQVLTRTEGCPSIVIDKNNVGYDWDGGPQYPSGDRMCILNFE